MMKIPAITLIITMLVGIAACERDIAAVSVPEEIIATRVSVINTEVIGGFVGGYAPLHPQNLQPSSLEWYGTDLGFSYRHGNRIEFLFGDSWSVESYAPIEASSGPIYDDSFGSVSLIEWPDGNAINQSSIPRVLLGENLGTRETAAINPGYVMDLGKTPMGGFSTGLDEFAIFNLTKPQSCTTNRECGPLVCDVGLGTLGAPANEEAGLTLPCVKGTPYCAPQTILSTKLDIERVPSGLCVDITTFPNDRSDMARTTSAAIRVVVGKRDAVTPKLYGQTREWLTSKFMNVAVRTVQSFSPTGSAPDFTNASALGKTRKVFLWGRPAFVGNKAKDRPLGLYFAYVDLPEGEDYSWTPKYFSGIDATGAPQFSGDQSDAIPLDLDSELLGYQSEQIDIVNQMSVVWEPNVEKWVMFYGGGLNTEPTVALPLCGVLQLFAGPECRSVNTGNGAIRMRTADMPWGPWTPPQDVIVGGDPKNPDTGQFAPGGLLRHPECIGEACADHSDSSVAYMENETGFFYAANIIEEWTVIEEEGVILTWNVSTWDPYRVALLKTRLELSHNNHGHLKVHKND